MDSIFFCTAKFLANESSDILYLSDSFWTFMGYTPEEISAVYNNSFLRLICPEDLPRIKTALYPPPALETKTALDYRVIKKDGSILWLHDSRVCLQEHGSKIYSCELSCTPCYDDLDDYYKSVLDSMANPVIITDETLHLTFLNQAARKTYPLKEDYHGKPCSSFQTPHCHTSNCCFKRYKRGDSAAIQHDPQGRSFRVVFSPLLTASGARKGYVSVSMDITELVETQQQLKISEERYKVALEQTNGSIWEYDFFTKKLSLLSSTEKTSLGTGGPGSVFENAPDSLFESGLLHPDSREAFSQAFKDAYTGHKLSTCEIQVKTCDNSYRWFKLSANTIYDEQGKPLRSIGVTLDVTEQKTLEDLYNQERRYRTSFTSDAISTYEVNLSTDALLHVDTDRLRPLQEVPADGKYSSLVRIAADNLVFPLHREKMKTAFSLSSLLTAFEHGKREVQCEYQRLSGNGNFVWVRCSAYLIETDEGDIHAFLYLKNIEEEKVKEEELRKKAELDPLTGLYNRAASVLRIEQNLARTAENGGIGALLMLDIDNFKQINDTYGHVYGDAVLSELAGKLTGLFRKEDIVGRLGGDEFIVYLQNIPEKEAALKKARQVCKTMQTVYSSLDRECILSCSLGVAFSPYHGIHFDALYQRADSALYHAKLSGKNQIAVYYGALSQHLPVREDIPDNSQLRRIFSDNLTDYIFKILYHSDNVGTAITAVLELLCKHYDTQHGYVVERFSMEGHGETTFEWCSVGVSKFKDLLHEIPSDQLCSYYNTYFQEDIFVVDSTGSCSPEIAQGLKQTGVRSFIQCAILTGGEFYGFVGLGEYRKNRVFTEEEKDTLRVVCEIIGIFLHRFRIQQQKQKYTSTLQTVLDNMDSSVYVINPADYRLAFINQKTKKLFPKAKNGDCCYQTFRGYASPCPDCPVKALDCEEHTKVTREIYNRQLGVWVETCASRVEWPDGGSYCLLDCTDITKYKSTKKSDDMEEPS